METLQKQTSLFTEDIAMFLPEDSLANHIALQESERAKKMTDTSGQKCLEQLERFNQLGLWAKTFSALLIGMEGWYSTKCKLTWKLRGTKYSRMYCQLYPSTLPIDGIGFGLLPTVTTQETPHMDAELTETGRRKSANGNSHSLNLIDYAIRGLLPTVRARAAGGNCSNDRRKGNLEDVIASTMLPTPIASEGGKMSGGPTENQMSMTKLVRQEHGTTSQLNPPFVLEMMGFPPDWTLLPFLNGETNP